MPRASCAQQLQRHPLPRHSAAACPAESSFAQQQPPPATRFYLAHPMRASSSSSLSCARDAPSSTPGGTAFLPAGAGAGARSAAAAAFASIASNIQQLGHQLPVVAIVIRLSRRIEVMRCPCVISLLLSCFFHVRDICEACAQPENRDQGGGIRLAGPLQSVRH
jgi:hypothetical protein